MRAGPSKLKGVVTIPTVRQPNSFAIEATTGALPVPVPPPIPAVINTISAPVNEFLIVSRSSSAALHPTSGLPPAPRPPVSFCPIGILTGAVDLFKACKSVLITINSTCSTPSESIRLIAFEPPPPQPIATKTAGVGFASSPLTVFTTSCSIILFLPNPIAFSNFPYCKNLEQLFKKSV